MSSFIEVVVGSDVLEFPENTSEAEIRSAVESFLSSKSYQSGLPSPNDLTPETGNPAVIGSATKYMTEPFRDLMSFSMERPATKALADIPIAGPTLSATAGRAADAGLLALGTLGTGFAGALSAPVEAYGLLASPTGGEKRQLARDVMGMVESMPVLGMGYAMGTRPNTMARLADEPEKRIAASEFRDLDIAPPVTVYGGIPQSASQALEEFPIIKQPIVEAKEALARRAGEVVQEVSPAASRQEGGEALLRGTQTFIKESGEEADKLYKKLDKLLPPESVVDTKNTLEYLEEAVAATKGLPAVESLVGETKSYRALIKDLKGEKSDLSEGALELVEDVFGSLDGLPNISDPQLKLKTLRKLRTKIGESLDDNSGPLAASLDRSSRKKLYGALSRDLEAAAEAAGPKASKAFKDANDFYNKRMERIENVFGSIVDIKDPEQAYRYISSVVKTGSAKESIRILDGLKKRLPEEDFDVVSRSIISRLGKKTDDLDEVFDPKVFLDQWGKINPSAKRVLAASSGRRGVYEQLEKLNRALSKVSESEVVEAGTRLRTRQMSQDAGRILMLGAAYGAASNLPATILSALGAFATTRLMTDPRFLKAVNSMVANDFKPMRALSMSKDFGSTEARAILYSMNMIEQNDRQE